MSQEMIPSNEPTQVSEAAELLAAGELSQAEIAERVGVDRRTLWRWRQDPEFMAKVEAIRAGLSDQAYDRGVALRFLRIKALNDRWNRLRRVIEARADDPDLAGAPGGSTGLLVRKIKSVRDGNDNRLVEEFEVDTGLLAELRAIEQHAAKELGQWTDKQEVSGKDGGPIEITATARSQAEIELTQWRKSMTLALPKPEAI